MDLSYILFNTIVYGTIALIIGSIFAYQKYFNFSVGILFIACSYLVYFIYNNGLDIYSILFIIGLFLIIFLSNHLIVSKFKNLKTREFFGLVFSLALGIFCLNLLGLTFGPQLISIPSVSIDFKYLLALLLIICLLIFYILNYSYLGKIFKGIYEKEEVIKSLGINTQIVFNIYLFFLILLLIFISYINLLNTNMRPSDDIFFLLKGKGIMLLVGAGKLEYIYIGAFLYVLAEYLLFIKIGLPISFKEGFILVVILVLLFFKPNGLFILKSRNI